MNGNGGMSLPVSATLTLTLNLIQYATFVTHLLVIYGFTRHDDMCVCVYDSSCMNDYVCSG